jgi:hypothetical protein
MSFVKTEKGWAVRCAEGAWKPHRPCRARVLNACGTVRAHLQTREPTHGAWQRVQTRFGAELQAYTLAGNVSVQLYQTIFKGAVGKPSLLEVTKELFVGMMEPGDEIGLQLELVVMQARLGRSLHISVGCLLERALLAYPWARVVGRLEEVCNNVLFTIQDWGAMLEALGVAAAWRRLGTPTTSMVSLTSRGVITVRITWVEGVKWEDNEPLVAVTNALARFVYELV